MKETINNKKRESLTMPKIHITVNSPLSSMFEEWGYTDLLVE
jgi:hypothetical protein